MMKYIAEILGVIGLAVAIVAGLFASGYFGPVDEISWPGGSGEEFQITLDAAQIDAEIARLRGLPGDPLPVSLGAVATARVACTRDLMADRPGPVATEAANRYFLIVLAARKRAESPLIDPRTRGISFGDGNSLDDPFELAARGAITDAKLQEWDQLVAAYRRASHPIHAGLKIEESKWAKADFGKIVTTAQSDAERVRTCYRARVGG